MAETIRAAPPPPGAQLPVDGEDFQQDDAQTQSQTLSLTPLDLSYRYAYDMAYDSEPEDDMTPTPSPTFAPSELYMGGGTTSLAGVVSAPSGSRWHRPWMAAS